MGIFDKFRRKSSSLTIEKIMLKIIIISILMSVNTYGKIMFLKVGRQIIYRESC